MTAPQVPVQKTPIFNSDDSSVWTPTPEELAKLVPQEEAPPLQEN